MKFGVPFPRGLKTRPGETVVFAYIVYKSRTHRERVTAKIMKDPRMKEMRNARSRPFDCNRMLYGGFKTLVEA